MTRPSSLSDREIFKQLDERVRRVDEARWLSSRYAKIEDREALITLYAFYYELARVRLAVSDAGLGAIRFQWWRDALEEMGKGALRQHDVVIALAEQVEAGRLSLKGLNSLIDGHEAAFDARDRGLEPEARLAALATKILAPLHSWGEALQELAPHWAGLRRGEALGYGPEVKTVPKQIRPAVAHFRLRRIWGAGQAGSAVSHRLCILRGILFGKV